MYFKKTLVILAGLAFAGSAAAASCEQQIGKAKAALLVNQCKNVSPATHPPCSASNACELIEDEIKRSCKLLDEDAPAFCPATTEAVKGTLVRGGGIDAYFLVIRTDEGREIHAYCKDTCGDVFTAPDKDDAVWLKPKFKGKRVSATISSERNNGSIAGPGDDDRVHLIKQISIGKSIKFLNY